MQRAIEFWHSTVERLEGLGQWLAPFALRVILFWEFWEAGREKFSGTNWFMNIQDKFPFPFNLAPSDLSWAMATWFELIGAVALLLGLATRFFAFSLSVLTIVAIASVHWPSDIMGVADLLMGYAITDRGHGNYKLPLIFLVMLLPLVLRGAGRLSLDALIAHLMKCEIIPKPNADGYAWGFLAIALGLPLAMLLPVAGLGMAGAGLLLVVVTRQLRP
ncbi:DoxX family protein [Pseudomarimonas arenosa]|uniref:DoxX family protein n=1 Tax=Pseudomarimonas arenosa TaxID=2774145 RepID=A0AAW3ZMZ1_9GAMM|nr:DoxX family protein [Pseudomarimonas arenosa]MBD8526539.1 DoxX family protein [Pseudomarimonas arenosa]